MSTRLERATRARELRDQGMLLREIGAAMGVSYKTVHAWLVDPDGSALQARKDSYGGVCDTCGGATDGSRGIGRSATRCRECLNWTPDAILLAITEYADEHGGIPPREVDTEPGHDGHGALPPSGTAKNVFGSWNAALLAAGYPPHQDKSQETYEAMLAAVIAGEDVNDIADRYGCSRSAVENRLRRRGTPISKVRRAA